jgi:hypothetical protein
MSQQFPFTLRALHDTTREELQAELYEQLQEGTGAPAPTYTSGEVLTLFHEAAGRALIKLSEGALSISDNNRIIQQVLQQEREAAARKPTDEAKEYALVAPTKTARKPVRKPAKRARR